MNLGGFFFFLFFLLTRRVCTRGCGGSMYNGVLKRYACESQGGHRGEIRQRGSGGKPNPSPSQKHPKADYLLQRERKGERVELNGWASCGGEGESN